MFYSKWSLKMYTLIFLQTEFAVITVENGARLHVTFVSHVAYITLKMRLFQNKFWAQLNDKLTHICVTPINSYSNSPPTGLSTMAHGFMHSHLCERKSINSIFYPALTTYFFFCMVAFTVQGWTET